MKPFFIAVITSIFLSGHGYSQTYQRSVGLVESNEKPQKSVNKKRDSRHNVPTIEYKTHQEYFNN